MIVTAKYISKEQAEMDGILNTLPSDFGKSYNNIICTLNHVDFQSFLRDYDRLSFLEKIFIKNKFKDDPNVKLLIRKSIDLQKHDRDLDSKLRRDQRYLKAYSEIDRIFQETSQNEKTKKQKILFWGGLIVGVLVWLCWPLVVAFYKLFVEAPFHIFLGDGESRGFGEEIFGIIMAIFCSILGIGLFVRAIMIALKK